MKLIDILHSVNKHPLSEQWVDLELICSELHLDLWGLQQEEARLTAYWVLGWCCTDTWVGMCAYYLDDNPVFFTTQTARKNNVEFTWIDKDSRLKVQDYLLSLSENEEEDDYEYMDKDEFVVPYFKVQYAEQVIPHYEAYLNGERVHVVGKPPTLGDGSMNFYTCSITGSDYSNQRQVDVRDLDFKINI